MLTSEIQSAVGDSDLGRNSEFPDLEILAVAMRHDKAPSSEPIDELHRHLIAVDSNDNELDGLRCKFSVTPYKLL